MQQIGRIGAVALIVVLCVLARATGVQAQEAVYTEDDVKAAFLYHFGSYVEWPETKTLDDPITIAVLGAPNVAEQLEMFLPGRTIQARPVGVRKLETIEEIADDEILFIGSQFNDRLGDVIAPLAERPMLIVSDAEDGLDQGAMVNFQVVDERLRFEVSLPAAERAGLMLSSRLLSAALRVETVNCRPGCPPHLEPREYTSVEAHFANEAGSG